MPAVRLVLPPGFLTSSLNLLSELLFSSLLSGSTGSTLPTDSTTLSGGQWSGTPAWLSLRSVRIFLHHVIMNTWTSRGSLWFSPGHWHCLPDLERFLASDFFFLLVSWTIGKMDWLILFLVWGRWQTPGLFGWKIIGWILRGREFLYIFFALLAFMVVFLG